MGRFKHFMLKLCFHIFVLGSLALLGCVPELGPFFKKVDVIPPNSALVYFYRPLRLPGYRSWYDVKSFSETVAVLPSGAYYPYFAKPGKTEFNVWPERPVSLDVQAGQTYYIRMLIRKGSFTAEPILEQVPSAIGEEEIKDCRLTPFLHSNNIQSSTENSNLP